MCKHPRLVPGDFLDVWNNPLFQGADVLVCTHFHALGDPDQRGFPEPRDGTRDHHFGWMSHSWFWRWFFIARHPLPWRCRQTFKKRLILEHVLLGMLCGSLFQLSLGKLETLLLLSWGEKRFRRLFLVFSRVLERSLSNCIFADVDSFLPELSLDSPPTPPPIAPKAPQPDHPPLWWSFVASRSEVTQSSICSPSVVQPTSQPTKPTSRVVLRCPVAEFQLHSSHTLLFLGLGVTAAS